VIEREIEIHRSLDFLIKEIHQKHVENCRLVSDNQKLYSVVDSRSKKGENENREWKKK
jgi:hypothetical protein